MLVDCDSCVVRGAACGGCVVSVVLGAPPAGVELDDDERRALRVLADAGMVPRLRLVTDGGAEQPMTDEPYSTDDLWPTDKPIGTPVDAPRPRRRGPRRIA